MVIKIILNRKLNQSDIAKKTMGYNLNYIVRLVTSNKCI